MADYASKFRLGDKVHVDGDQHEMSVVAIVFEVVGGPPEYKVKWFNNQGYLLEEWVHEWRLSC